MRQIIINGYRIADDEPPFTIAECSHNHLGSADLCREMIRLAAEAGADAVKLQKRGPSTYAGLRAVGEGEYAALREGRELWPTQYVDLRRYAHDLGVAFIATAFDRESADMLAAVGVDALKVASGDVCNIPLLRHIAGLGKPMLVSTGGCDIADVLAAHKTLTAAGARFALLHCTSEYPVDSEHVNLRVIETYRKVFPNTVIGFSSHVDRRGGAGLEAMAYILGARIIEKHFTITPDLPGEHAFALTPDCLRRLCTALRRMPAMLGDGVKSVLPCEAAGIRRLGKHLAYSRALTSGVTLDEAALDIVGGGVGLPPSRLAGLVGGVLARSVVAGESVQEGDILCPAS